MIAGQGLTVGTVNNWDGIKTCVAENCPRFFLDLRNRRNLRFKIRNFGLPPCLRDLRASLWLQLRRMAGD
jgi:hypothetical protein